MIFLRKGYTQNKNSIYKNMLIFLKNFRQGFAA